MTTTTRWGWRYPSLTDDVDIPQDIQNLATDLDGVMVDDQGLIAARPVSTGGSPGKRGRMYYATDQVRLYRDFGTGWSEVTVDPTTLGAKAATIYEASAPGLLTNWSSLIAGIGQGTYVLDTASGAFNIGLNPFIIPSVNPYLVTGPTTPKLRSHVTLITNYLLTNTPLDVSLRPITWSGIADQISPDYGSSKAGSIASFSSQAGSTAVTIVSTGLDVPAAGSYCFAVSGVSSAATPGCYVCIVARLELYYV